MKNLMDLMSARTVVCFITNSMIKGKQSQFYTLFPALAPLAHAHWKLYPPRCPVTSTTSPMKNNPGCSLDIMPEYRKLFIYL